MHSRVLGVLAGDRLKPEWLRPWVDSADVVIAADAGADFVVAADRVPAVLVGDLDSVSEKTRQIVPLVAEHQEQESSDCDKLLAHVRSMGSESVTLCGAEGRRIDHMVATLGSAARSDLRVTIAYEEMIAYVLRGPVDIRLAHQGLVSLLPLTDCEEVTISGVRWPLTKVSLHPIRQISLSNESEGPLRIQMASGSASLFLPYDGSPTWTDPRLP